MVMAKNEQKTARLNFQEGQGGLRWVCRVRRAVVWIVLGKQYKPDFNDEY